jgi:hypothetical protein
MDRFRGIKAGGALMLGIALGYSLVGITSCATTRAYGKPLPENHALWVKVGQCEQPGKGYRGVNWSHHGPTYEGGLGFAASSWDAYKPKGYPENAGDATWRQQMVVANRLWARAGWGWGCDLR